MSYSAAKEWWASAGSAAVSSAAQAASIKNLDFITSVSPRKKQLIVSEL